MAQFDPGNDFKVQISKAMKEGAVAEGGGQSESHEKERAAAQA